MQNLVDNSSCQSPLVSIATSQYCLDKNKYLSRINLSHFWDLDLDIKQKEAKWLINNYLTHVHIK